MRFNQHLELEGRHAFLSPSSPHWLNYEDERLLERYDNHMNAQLGTRLHNIAKELIDLGLNQPNTTQTFNMYVNDCIGYRMSTEIPLFATPNCFGTADAISYDEETGLLRIFDLKNGVTPTKFTQLEVYAALFCIEYKKRPMELEYDLRIYQSDEVRHSDTTGEDIAYIISRIESHDKLLKQQKGV